MYDSQVSMATQNFKEYIDVSFPEGGKRTKSAVICREYTDRIVKHLKGTSSGEDKILGILWKEQILASEFAWSWSQRHAGGESERKQTGKNDHFGICLHGLRVLRQTPELAITSKMFVNHFVVKSWSPWTHFK